MRAVVANGKPGTAMLGFAGRLDEAQIADIVAYVRAAFVAVTARPAVGLYHSAQNGWENHAQRYASAYPFATGEIALDVPRDHLTPAQRAGRELFVAVCITCHERGGGPAEFTPRVLSFPRNGVTPRTLDSVSGATTFARHDVKPPAAPVHLRVGERLFQQNCTMCHGADGSGRNWIGQFIEPHAADLRALDASGTPSREFLRNRIREGVAGSAMPAWRTVLPTKDIDAVVDYLCGAIVATRHCRDP